MEKVTLSKRVHGIRYMESQAEGRANRKILWWEYAWLD